MIYTDFNSGNNDDYLITPQIALSGNEQLRFSYRVQSSGEPNDFQITLSTTGTSPSDFTTTLVPLASYNNTTYQEMIVNLSDFSGDVNIAFHVPSGGLDGWRLYIDDVNVEEIPSCIDPSDVAASNVTSSEAELSWDEEATATLGYQWVVMDSGTLPAVDGSEVATGGTDASTFMASVSGLNSDSSYDAYVRSVCDGGEFSDWSNVANFTTTLDFCGGDIFTDDGGTADDYSLNQDEVTTISPENSGDVVYVEFLSFETELGYDGILIYDGPDTSAPLIDSGFISNFQFSILPDGAWNGTSAQGLTFFSTHPTGSLTFRFISDDLFVEAGWEAEVTCGPPPTCFIPENVSATNFTSDGGELSWDAEDSATLGYQWVIMNAGEAPAVDGSEVATGGTDASTFMASVTGLNSASFYTAYVRSVCDGGVFSDWSVAEGFRTAPVCGETFFDNGEAAGNYTNFSNETITISPDNVGDVVSVEFLSFAVENSFDGLLIYDGPDTSSPLIDSGGSGFNNAPDGSWTGTGDFSADGETFTSTHPSGSLTFVFVSDDSFVLAGWEAEVTCGPPPTCFAPESLSASNVSASGVDLSWDTDSSATLGYQWVVMASGDVPAVDGSEAATGNTASDMLMASVSGLEGSTAYDAYVRSICDGGEFSVWSDEVSFTTLIPNDDFADAIAVACGDNYTGSTDEATVDGPFASPNVWYSFTGSGIIQSVTLDLCDSNYDTRVRVYTGTSGNLTLLAENDDFCSLQSQLTFESDGSTTYYISVEGFSVNSIGDYDLDVTCVDLPTLAFQENFSSPTAALSGSIAFHDVDGDDDQDFIITGATQLNQFGLAGGQISRLYKNDGNGNFSITNGTPFMGLSYSSLSFVDVNFDGFLDVMSAGENYTTGVNYVKYYANDGVGNFTETTGTPFPPNIKRTDFKIADFDNDGINDILFLGLFPNGSPSIRLFENQGTDTNPNYFNQFNP